MKTIVTISRDADLQAIRTTLMKRIGFAVFPLGSDVAVQEFLTHSDPGKVDLILMCHSVPETSRVELCKALKLRYPHSPILMLYNGYDPTTADVDGRLENVHSPEVLVEVIGLLAKVS